MSHSNELNKSLNKTLRNLSEVTKLLVNGKSKGYENDLEKAVEAVSLISDIQRCLYNKVPELSWHCEENKKDTSFMSEIRNLLKEAHDLENSGDIEGSAKVLQKALQLEPPAIQYEVIESELRRIQSIS